MRISLQVATERSAAGAGPVHLVACRLLRSASLCESALFGNPICVGPTKCWHMSWVRCADRGVAVRNPVARRAAPNGSGGARARRWQDEREANARRFEAMRRQLLALDALLLLRSPTRGPTTLVAHYVLLPALTTSGALLKVSPGAQSSAGSAVG